VLTLAERSRARWGARSASIPRPSTRPTSGRSAAARAAAARDAAEHGKTDRTAPVFIQSFEPANLQLLRPQTTLRLILLLEATADVSPARLAEIKTFADGIGPNTRLDRAGQRRRHAAGADDAGGRRHEAGLLVHVWTLRSEPAFLSPSYGGDPIKEYRQFAELGVDGIFGDFPDVAFAALRK
jgi:glycerophosphoryl diester phosphodiesterase